MALAVKRTPGLLLTFTITGGGTITSLISMNLDIEQGDFDATAATATFDQFALGRKRMSGTYRVFVGTEGIPPALGDTLSVIQVLVGVDEVTPTTIDDNTVYGVIKVNKVGWAFGAEPGTAEVGFKAGYIA